MKLTKTLLIVTLACGTLWAQAPAKPATKPMASKPATPAPATKSMAKPMAPAKTQAKPTVPVKPVAAPMRKMAPAKPMTAQKKPAVVARPVRVAVKKSSKPAMVGETKPASVKEEAVSTHPGKMRDPFVSPVVRSGGNIGSGCDTGKRCLVVDQIVLKGIVKSPAGFIAVVENPAKRAYFMRENDPVFNGKVVRITGDTVVFQEQVTDKVGKQSMREVVKKVNAPIV